MLLKDRGQVFVGHGSTVRSLVRDWSQGGHLLSLGQPMALRMIHQPRGAQLALSHQRGTLVCQDILPRVVRDKPRELIGFTVGHVSFTSSRSAAVRYPYGN